MSSKYVSTDLVKAAVRGREVDVIRALGITGFESGRHIDCPFPEHGGKVDWRWDAAPARWICTCGHGDIFDFVQKMRGCNFTEAVKFVVEVIGGNPAEAPRKRRRRTRPSDLGKGDKQQPGKALAVLNPGEAVRDDELLRVYHAYRLRIDPADVVMPSTPFAGHREALYYAPGDDGKLREIGTFPMIAFGMVGVDGRQHAHRIYTAPDGQGKAEIIHPENGEKLNPKKLMPVAANELNTAGLAVIFGDTSAPTCLLTEGIETAAAVAYACRAEITSKGLYVAAAISAGGVEKFQPWPNTKTIIVMADRDERAKGRGKKPSRAGEIAARRIGLRMHGSDINVFCSLPGNPGEKVDWLDVLCRDGVGAVHKGINDKERFEPTADELRELESSVDLGDDSRPLIEIQAGKLHELVDQCATAIGPSNRIFKRGAMLVHAVRVTDPTAHAIERPRGSLILAPVEADFLRVMLAEAASVVKWNGQAKRLVHADPPLSLANAVLACPDRWGPIPEIRSISEGPIITPSGRIIGNSGLDHETSILFDVGDLEISVPDHPTKENARAALDELLELLSEFAFADDASQSVALCELLTPFVRPLVPAAPAFINEAPKAGSGKSQLARVSGLLATGRAPAVMNQPDNAESEAKRIFSMLMEGASVAVIDNVERPLRSDLLCSVLTEPVIRDRVLGASKTVTVPTTSTWIATGNNLKIIGDLTRRVLSCQIDAGVERPEERAFKRNIDQYTLKNRARLVSAALTVIRAYIVSAERVKVTPFNSFGEWSRMVREALVWLGEADPCSTRERVSERDPIAQALGNFLEVWDSLFGEEPMTAGAALQKVNSLDSDRPDVMEAFCGINLDGRMPNSRQLGNYLTRFEGRIERGRKIIKDGVKKRAVVWRIVDSLNLNVNSSSSKGELVSLGEFSSQPHGKLKKNEGGTSYSKDLLELPGLNSPKLTNSPIEPEDDRRAFPEKDGNEKPTGGSIVI